MAAENEHREDDPLSVKIAKCKRMLASGATPDKLAIFFGVTRQTVYNWTKVAEASVDVQKAVETGAMSMTEAVKVSAKPRAEQKQAAKAAKEAVEAGAPPKKRGRPKGGAMSRKRACQMVLKAVEEAGKGKHLVHPEFERGLRFALEQMDAKEAGVEKIIEAMSKKGAK
jgi:hypothetical protein